MTLFLLYRKSNLKELVITDKYEAHRAGVPLYFSQRKHRQDYCRLKLRPSVCVHVLGLSQQLRDVIKSSPSEKSFLWALHLEAVKQNTKGRDRCVLVSLVTHGQKRKEFGTEAGLTWPHKELCTDIFVWRLCVINKTKETEEENVSCWITGIVQQEQCAVHLSEIRKKKDFHCDTDPREYFEQKVALILDFAHFTFVPPPLFLVVWHEHCSWKQVELRKNHCIGTKKLKRAQFLLQGKSTGTLLSQR